MGDGEVHLPVGISLVQWKHGNNEPALSFSTCTAVYHTGIFLAHYVYFSSISTNPNLLRGKKKEGKNGKGYLKFYYRESNTPQARAE